MPYSQMRLTIAMATMTFVAVLVWSLPSQAASPGANFSCNVTRKICSCDVNKTGDCDGMKKNCKDGSIGWCNEINGKNICFCGMAKGGLGKDKLKALENAPDATAQ